MTVPKGPDPMRNGDCDCRSCDDDGQEEDDEAISPLKKKPKLWAHSLLAIVSPERQPRREDAEERPPAVDVSSVEDRSDRPRGDGGREIAVVADPDELAEAIFREEVQLAVWRRRETPRFVRALASATLDQSRLPSFNGIVTAETCVGLMRRKLVPCGGAAAAATATLAESAVLQLIRDVQRLVEVFGGIIAEGMEVEDDEQLAEGGDENEQPEPAEGEAESDQRSEGGEETEQRRPSHPKVHVRLECLEDNGCQFWHQDTVPLRLLATYRGPCTEYVDPEHSKATLMKRGEDSPHAQSLTHRDVAIFKGRVFYGECGDEDIDDLGEDASEDDDVADQCEGAGGGEEVRGRGVAQNVGSADRGKTQEEPGVGASASTAPKHDEGGSEEEEQVEEEKEEEEEEDGADIDALLEEMPDLDSLGIVHRSPRILGSDVVRVVLVLDIPAAFHNNDDGEEDDGSSQ